MEPARLLTRGDRALTRLVTMTWNTAKLQVFPLHSQATFRYDIILMVVAAVIMGVLLHDETVDA